MHIGELDSKLSIIENERPVKLYRFDKDGSTKESFEAVQEFSYPVENITLNSENAADNAPKLKQTETTYGADGEFHFRTSRYEKENSPYKDDIVNFETKPFELEEKLKADGIRFARSTDYINDFMTTKITAFDPKSDDVTRYEFLYDEGGNDIREVVKCNIDKDGGLNSEICFRKDETSYTEFKDNVMY